MKMSTKFRGVQYLENGKFVRKDLHKRTVWFNKGPENCLSMKIFNISGHLITLDEEIAFI